MIPLHSKGMFASLGVFLAHFTALINPTSGVDDYLYKGDTNATPVVELVKPDKNESESDEQYISRIRHPEFLDSDDSGPRFVEFYAPWCPHCQHFKPKYISIAQKITTEASDVKFYAISCTMHADICKDNEVHGYPTLKYFSPGNDSVVIPMKEHNFSSMIRYLNSKTDRTEDHVREEIKKINNGNQSNYVTQGNSSTKAQIYHDATTSFIFALRHSIFMTNEPLTNDKAITFETWLDLLYKTLPKTMSEMKNTILVILNDISVAVLDEKNLMNMLTKKEIGMKGIRKNGKFGGVDPNILGRGWTTACTHGVSDSGYTCGLWELFHIMTIGLVERNTARSKPISTMHAAETLNNYIKHFFACDVCRQNFNAEYDSCSFGRCNRLNWNETISGEIHWKQLPLWLWQLHNDVNMRLFREEKERLRLPEPSFEEQRTVLWPSTNDCNECWNVDGSWQEDEVYHYLKQHYWPTDTETFNLEADSTSFVLYLISIIFILLFSLWLFMRGRKWQLYLTGHHKKADDFVV